jgi:hypothetical protein
MTVFLVWVEELLPGGQVGIYREIAAVKRTAAAATVYANAKQQHANATGTGLPRRVYTIDERAVDD